MPDGAGPDVGGVPIYGPFTILDTAGGAQVVNRSSGWRPQLCSIHAHFVTILTLTVAALAFLVWDILITFDDEVC